ncbi:MAG: hypothetical protein IJT12_02075 [Paludibacteraceae bacterium]|nr:hypothetical protein [Paludibacteraceae bacterium]
MQEFQVFDWAAIGARIREKRVFLYWFIPVTFILVWALTFSVPNYFTSEIALSTEMVHSEEGYRSFTLNRPENFDLGLSAIAYSISPDDYVTLVASTDFICRVLATPVMTADTSFTGTYYEYLETQNRYPWHKALVRLMRGKKNAEVGEPLPELDPFFPRGRVAEAIGLAQKNISCYVDRQTKLTTLTIKAQDPLVAALVAQSAAEILKQVTSEYYLDKTERVYEHLEQQIVFVHDQYLEALKSGDKAYADMLNEAHQSFSRQAILLNAQMRYYQIFTTLSNASVPTEKAGPHHLSVAFIATILIGLIALCIICRKELFG